VWIESLIATRGLWVRGGRKRILVPAVLLEDDESNERKVSFKTLGLKLKRREEIVVIDLIIAYINASI